MKRAFLATLAVALLAASATVHACTLGTATGCSTAVANGITSQIVQEMKNMGYSYTTLDSTWVRCSSPCVNQLQSVAASALVKAAKSKNDYITLNSALRSSAQQYLLYTWYLAGKCGITAAAKPGTSNHETGLAIDTSNYNYWMSALESYGWDWYGSGDAVHFDYEAGGSDLRKQNLMAFQRLWNRNNPNSTQLVVDGVYGTATANAFKGSPCNGW